MPHSNTVASGSGYEILSDQIRISSPTGEPLAELNLRFAVGAKSYAIRELQKNSDGWTGLTADPEVTVKITQGATSLCVELCGPFGPGQDVIYFHDSKISATHAHAFIPDIHQGAFRTGKDRTFTLTNQAALRERMGFAEEVWMIAPQPHVIGFGDSHGFGFSFSIPECLPVDATQFSLRDRGLHVAFVHHVAACENGRMPRVFIDLATTSRHEMLARHLAHAREIGLVLPDKPQPAWWHNPLYCTWGDQCLLLQRDQIGKPDVLTRERILAWADKIRTFYDGEVNFIIDDGYFLAFGDFRLRPHLYGSTEDFRSLIAELQSRNFRVILWYTPFWVEPDAKVVVDHPEWLLHRRDGSLLDDTGDWKGKYHFDWSHPEVRDYHKGIIGFLLGELKPDGLKIDMTYAYPPGREVLPHDATWASGNLVCRKTIEFIHTEATKIKPDVFLTINGTESYLQPFASAVRLNDLFDFDNATAWYRRAELVTRVMPDVAIDVDGWPASLTKIREYPFVASVFGAPVTYYLDGTEIGEVAFGDEEINRLAAVWHTYANAPVESGQSILIDAENNIFERRDVDGRLRATSLARRALVTYGRTIRVAANSDLALAVPLENGLTVTKAFCVRRDGSRSPVSLHNEDGRALFFAEDSAKGILYYELE